MSETQIVLNEVMTDKTLYTVGERPGGLEFPVKEIKYYSNSDNYNKGRQFEGPCYVIFFQDNDTRRIVPKDHVIDVGIELIQKEKKSKNPEEVGIVNTQ